MKKNVVNENGSSIKSEEIEQPKLFSKDGKEVHIGKDGKVPFDVCICEQNVVTKTRKSGAVVNVEKRKYYLLDENSNRVIVKLDGTVKLKKDKKIDDIQKQSENDDYEYAIRKAKEDILIADKAYDATLNAKPFSIEAYQQALKDLQRKKDHLKVLKNLYHKSPVYDEYSTTGILL